MEISTTFKEHLAQVLEQYFAGIDPDHKPDGTAVYNRAVNACRYNALAQVKQEIEAMPDLADDDRILLLKYAEDQAADKVFSMYPIVVTKNKRLKGMKPVDKRR